MEITEEQRKFDQLIQGGTVGDFAHLLNLQEWDGKIGVYDALNHVVNYPKISEIPWPLAWCATRHNPKYISQGGPVPKEEEFVQFLVNLENKLKWKAVLKNKADERPKDLRTKTEMVAECNETGPNELEFLIHELRSKAVKEFKRAKGGGKAD